MGAREVLLAAALMAMAHRSLALSCLPCHWDATYANGTGANYYGYGSGTRRTYCSTPTCSYGLTGDGCCNCCDVCAKGPGESCNDRPRWAGCSSGVSCASGLVCQWSGNTYSYYERGTCVNKTTPVIVCPLDKGFILDEDDVCRCPAEKGLYVDEESNCVKCPIEVGYILSGGMCICDPIKGYIKDPNSNECICPPPSYKDENGDCNVATPPLMIYVCESNRMCPDNKACIRGLCVPPCSFEPCAKYAVCINKNHTAVCGCGKGYDGDAYIEDGCIAVTPTIRTTQETTSEDNPVTETYWNLDAPWNTHKRQ